MKKKGRKRYIRVKNKNEWNAQLTQTYGWGEDTPSWKITSGELMKNSLSLI